MNHAREAKNDSDGKAPIFVRLTVDCKRAEMSLGQKVHPKKTETRKLIMYVEHLFERTHRKQYHMGYLGLVEQEYPILPADFKI